MRSLNSNARRRFILARGERYYYQLNIMVMKRRSMLLLSDLIASLLASVTTTGANSTIYADLVSDGGEVG